MTDPFSKLKTKIMWSENSSFSLQYKQNGVYVQTDILAYRPDPRNYLTADVSYTAVLTFVEIYAFWEGKKIKNLISIYVPALNMTFSKLR